MIKIVSAFLFGFILLLPLDFLIFIGLKLYYFDLYKVKEYFNIYFFDNQPIVFMLIASLVFGYLILFSPLKKLLQLLYIVALCGCIAMLYKPLATSFGEDIFMEKNKKFQFGSLNFEGDIIYKGRTFLYIKRVGIEPTIRLKKDKVKILN